MRYNYSEWLRHKNLLEQKKKNLQTNRRNTLTIEEPPPPKPVNTKFCLFCFVVVFVLFFFVLTRCTTKEPLAAGASVPEYKKYMIAKFKYEEWENKQRLANNKKK